MIQSFPESLLSAANWNAPGLAKEAPVSTKPANELPVVPSSPSSEKGNVKGDMERISKKA